MKIYALQRGHYSSKAIQLLFNAIYFKLLSIKRRVKYLLYQLPQSYRYFLIHYIRDKISRARIFRDFLNIVYVILNLIN